LKVPNENSYFMSLCSLAVTDRVSASLTFLGLKNNFTHYGNFNAKNRGCLILFLMLGAEK
jgi:hypothetical protein